MTFYNKFSNTHKGFNVGKMYHEIIEPSNKPLKLRLNISDIEFPNSIKVNINYDKQLENEAILMLCDSLYSLNTNYIEFVRNFEMALSN